MPVNLFGSSSQVFDLPTSSTRIACLRRRRVRGDGMLLLLSSAGTSFHEVVSQSGFRAGYLWYKRQRCSTETWFKCAASSDFTNTVVCVEGATRKEKRPKLIGIYEQFKAWKNSTKCRYVGPPRGRCCAPLNLRDGCCVNSRTERILLSFLSTSL